MMGLRQVVSENPHLVPCPNGPHDPITDMYAELLEPTDRVAAATGQAAMICPLCDGKMYLAPHLPQCSGPGPSKHTGGVLVQGDLG
jgi:hypothetical protein